MALVIPAAAMGSAAGTAGAAAAECGGALVLGLQLGGAAIAGAVGYGCCKRRRTGQHDEGGSQRRLASLEARLARGEERLGRLEEALPHKADVERMKLVMEGKADARVVEQRMESLAERLREGAGAAAGLEQQVERLSGSLGQKASSANVEQRMGCIAAALDRKADATEVKHELGNLMQSFRTKADNYLACIGQSLKEKADAAKVNWQIAEVKAAQQSKAAEVDHKLAGISEHVGVLSEGLSAGIASATNEIEAVHALVDMQLRSARSSQNSDLVALPADAQPCV